MIYFCQTNDSVLGVNNAVIDLTPERTRKLLDYRDTFTSMKPLGVAFAAIELVSDDVTFYVDLSLAGYDPDTEDTGGPDLGLEWRPGPHLRLDTKDAKACVAEMHIQTLRVTSSGITFVGRPKDHQAHVETRELTWEFLQKVFDTDPTMMTKADRLLAAMGTETAHVAAFLEKAGIKGVPDSSNDDPIVRYLKRELGTQDAALEYGCVYIDSKGTFNNALALPPSVEDFVDRFDNWEFPQLLDETVELRKQLVLLTDDSKFLFANEGRKCAAVVTLSSIAEGGTPIVPHGFEDEGEDMELLGRVGLSNGEDVPVGPLDLRRYALPVDKAQPVCEPLQFAKVVWQVGDITSRTNLSDSEAEAFLIRNEKYIRDQLISTGNESVIPTLLHEEGIELTDD